MPAEILTTKLARSGLTVLAKLWHGSPCAVTYANRTQAYAARDNLRAQGVECWVADMRRPFYVVMGPQPS